MENLKLLVWWINLLVEEMGSGKVGICQKFRPLIILVVFIYTVMPCVLKNNFKIVLI